MLLDIVGVDSYCCRDPVIEVLIFSCINNLNTYDDGVVLPVVLEILQCNDATVLLNIVHQLFPDLAAIEDVGATVGDGLQGVGQDGALHYGPLWQRLAGGAVEEDGPVAQMRR